MRTVLRVRVASFCNIVFEIVEAFLFDERKGWKRRYDN